jgi:DNA mismatch repair protein MutS2
VNAHALQVLEFDRVLGLVAERASSAPGAARVRALTPHTDRHAAERELSRVAAMRALTEGDSPFRLEAIPDVEAALKRLAVPGSVLDARALLDAGILLRSSRLVRAALRDVERPAAARAMLAEYADALCEDAAAEQRIGRVFGEDGAVRDDASPDLRRIRRELRGAEGELIRLLERVLRSLEPSHQAPDLSITVRNGRYVIPVRREGRLAVGGIVHDASGSGATVFVEPPAAVEFGNRIRELELEEHDEIERILAELTDAIRPMAGPLALAWRTLVELDALYARAGFAAAFRCGHSTLVAPQDGVVIREGKHPLLVAQGRPVVPLELVLEPAEQTLLISGPNTGGKTVLLKAVGVFSAMAAAGIPPVVADGSRVAVYDDIFADVGDEQSLEASLSTFSAHLKNLREILAAATADSLVLVDELGSGTDPLEGASLGAAILETLTRRGARTLASTHLGQLKQLALEVPGVVNGSLRFDAEALAPTYAFIKGVPGRSYGLSIARRLGLPEDVLVNAEQRIPTAERDAMVLLADLEARSERIGARERELEQLLARAQDRERSVLGRERVVRDREKQIERDARKDARQFLLDARAEVERVVRELKGAGEAALEDAARAARRAVEQAAQREGAALQALEQPSRRERREQESATQRAERSRSSVPAPAVGDLVEVGTLAGKLGTLLEVRGGDGVVAVGTMKLTVPMRALTRSTREAPREKVSLYTDVPESRARTEVDLRGIRADEVDDLLLPAIDDAVRADLRSVRIIHGKGTGVLRDRVAELLRKDTRVKEFRLGLWNEGGAGVTIAAFE